MGKISKADYRFFEAARRVAETSDFDNFHIGCVLVYKKHIIASAANTNKTAPIQKKYNKYRNFNKSNKPIKDSLHAEIRALAAVPYPLAQTINWREVSVYVYRIYMKKIVDPSAVWLVNNTPQNIVTLITCADGGKNRWAISTTHHKNLTNQLGK